MHTLIVASVIIAAVWLVNGATYPTGEYEIADRSKYTAALVLVTVVAIVAWIAVLLNEVL